MLKYLVMMAAAGIVHLMAQPVAMPYEVEAGMIHYSVYGGGVLTPETNVSILGEEFFAFRQKGQERLTDTNRTEGLKGALESIKKQRILKHSDGKNLYLVDFDTQSIKQSDLLEYENGIVDLSGLKQTGMSEVASVVCDLWTSQNRKVCLYKGLVLMDEKTYLGFVYGKKATQIDFDANLTDKDFALPEFPVKEDMILRTKLKGMQPPGGKTLAEKILTSAKDIDPNDRAYNMAVEKFFKGVYTKEKEYFDALLKAMQNSRACLHGTQTQSDAVICMEDIRQIKEKYGFGQANDVEMWTSHTIGQILEGLERDISILESQMPCINRAQGLTDLSACMKQ